MAIYNDGKHNENMEYNAPKFEVRDKTIYRNAYFTFVGDNGNVYDANLVEYEIYDTWHIFDNEGNNIEEDDPKLYDELIALCEESLKQQ